MKSFGDFEPEFYRYDEAKIVLVPVPYDGTSTYVKGSDKGPAAIIDASPNLEFYDIETDSEVFKRGIYTDKPVLEKSSPEKMVEAVRKRVAEHLSKDKFTVVLGGEHSVSVGAIKAVADANKDMCVLQLDAHSDLRDSYHGSKYNHACAMARAKEICPIVQVGIRSMDSSEKKNMDRSKVFFAEEIYDKKDWQKRVVSKLSRNVYVTIDLDVFDPSMLSATGTPEPGGLFWYDVVKLLREVALHRNIIGFDVVELCPDKSKVSDFTAAKLVYKLLTYKFELKK